ncbi:hypothetical protein NC651_037683 [Populus alba x Populus x berolinensis]|nr:hypothetical protein NC651_037683 [Populus alba x Populus x berolinensis]
MLIAPRRASGHKIRFQRASPPLGHPLSSLVLL